MPYTPPTRLSRIRFAAEPFELAEVKVLGGPLKAAQDADAKYLLELNPDGFLNPYRRANGLEPKAPFYGGWESRYNGNSGEILGHYLSAISAAYAATGDKQFKQKVDYVVGEIALCQAQRTDGAILCDPGQAKAWEAVSKGEISVDNPIINGCVTWYRVHKIVQGLLDAEAHVGSSKAREVNVRYGDWACNLTKNFSESDWQTMLEAEFGGANDGFAALADRTGDPKYVALARSFYHQVIFDPLAAGRDELAGRHANTQIPKVTGEAYLYELTGDPRAKRIAEFFWDAVVHHHSFAIGGNSENEHFGLPDRIADALTENDCETCNTYNMEKLTRRLFTWQPKAEYGNWYERALFNHILGSQDPGSGMMCYFVPLESGHARKYSTPFESFWCCVGTGIENHMLHGSAVYYKLGVARLWVNLFVPSEVTWPEAGMTIRQETHFPADGAIKLEIVKGSPREFALSIRHPGWAQARPTVLVNGTAIQYALGGDGFMTIHRKWAVGDSVEVEFEMALHVEPTPGDESTVTLEFGPLVLAADMDEPVDAALSAADWPATPVLVAKDRPIETWLRRLEGAEMQFRTVNAARPRDYLFRPFSEVKHHRSATYFKLYSASEWLSEEQKRKR